MTGSALEEYVNKTRGDYYSGITKMMINRKAAYELKGNSLMIGGIMLSVEQMKKTRSSTLKIIDPLDLPNVSYERLRLAVFPISLTGEARETFNNHKGRNDEEAIQEEREPSDDHGIDNLDNDLVWDNASYHDNEEEEQYDKERCKLLGNPRQEHPVYKIGSFEVIKYSFGPSEKYIAIKECEYDNLTRIKEDACHAYQGIFRIMDEVRILEKDKNKDKTRQNRARNRKELKKTSPMVLSDLIGPARNPLNGPGQLNII
ncbi:hypothetical protein Tco_1267870 [Tanacetum coccineum]